MFFTTFGTCVVRKIGRKTTKRLTYFEPLAKLGLICLESFKEILDLAIFSAFVTFVYCMIYQNTVDLNIYDDRQMNYFIAVNKLGIIALLLSLFALLGKLVVAFIEDYKNHNK